mmetsp:Transcript_31196/g.69371  ORF Transcript_31196/g.69371 Transcript_31196/m.69371 type:complete len:104 (-) Transcript_31196:258-569(-)|eukprot:CAMPEP_0202901262 /NCGR_PEP_ID=MMETSP1392-20130828/14154_1 /ASSEMBLY_ACC=CAM_ASM_000868 /TAXON_ID=225041 /ORGANISM="Chlamydomonas chlamydogama, Strain SAG 11-48b" /LENGTH=103 /DNA_ID=CAMNT_0049587805 /DNA_START=139 /DNA_END=450 /DNA_ORIENTATION=-
MTGPGLAVYRKLLRTIHRTFQGDRGAIATVHQELRNQFNANKHVTSPSEINQRIADALEAEDFIRNNIVQAKKSSCGTYEMTPDNAKHLSNIAPEGMIQGKNQ